MRVERIGLDDLVDERRALAEAVGNVFATPEFHATWWRHFGRGEPDLRAVLDDDGELRGVLPLYRWRPGVRRFIGSGGGDELGPVARAADRADVSAAVAGTVVCEHVRPEWARALGARTVLAEASPVIRIGDFAGWDAFLGSRSSNFRQQVRSRTRKLEQGGDVAYRLADASTLDADVDHLFRLHRARWQRPSTFGSREAFHREFARVGLERGWTRLVVLEVDGVAAAAWYGFRFAEADAYYQSGRDPAYDDRSVGLVLLAHTIRTAFDDGRAEYRFLRGDEPYKFRFTDDDSRVESGVAGPLALPAATALRAFRSVSRRLSGAAARGPRAAPSRKPGRAGAS